MVTLKIIGSSDWFFVVHYFNSTPKVYEFKMHQRASRTCGEQSFNFQKMLQLLSDVAAYPPVLSESSWAATDQHLCCGSITSERSPTMVSYLYGSKIIQLYHQSFHSSSFPLYHLLLKNHHG
jgi:hypothetical protein